MAEKTERFEVRDSSGPGWEWLPGWCVVDTVKQVRAAAYNDEATAAAHCSELNTLAAEGKL